ncbi:MAG: hypothetical protein WAM64_02545, partial [Acidimicrobiales bacterium]
MSDLVELEEPVPQATRDTREEIRRISDRVRARRQRTSRIMVVFCGAALVLAAVPLVALMYQLFDKGLS